MALSSGARRAATMAAGWLAAAGAAAISLVYVSEIKDIARVALPIAAPSDVRPADVRPSREAAPARTPAAGRSVEIKAAANGHYVTRAEINGRPIDAMVDSGASVVALTFDDALVAGIRIRDHDYTQLVNTANGVARFAPIVLDRVSIGDITVRNVSAAVSEPGKLATSLLGMSFLSRLHRVDMRSGVLVLQE